MDQLILMRMQKLAYRCQQTWEPNNFLYKVAKISEQNLAKPPENGVLLNVSKVECGIEDNDQSDSNMDIDSGPIDFDENEKVYNTESEMGSFIRANVDT